MKTWQLVDGSTGVIDRSTNTVTRECDTWTICTETELLEILQCLAGQDLRAMMLESDKLWVGFGFNWYYTYVMGSVKHEPYSRSRSYFKAVRDEDCWSGHDVGFALWQDDLLEFSGQKLIPWSEALKILLWIVRHDELPDWDEESGCRPPSRASSGSPPPN